VWTYESCMPGAYNIHIYIYIYIVYEFNNFFQASKHKDADTFPYLFDADRPLISRLLSGWRRSLPSNRNRSDDSVPVARPSPLETGGARAPPSHLFVPLPFRCARSPTGVTGCPQWRPGPNHGAHTHTHTHIHTYTHTHTHTHSHILALVRARADSGRRNAVESHLVSSMCFGGSSGTMERVCVCVCVCMCARLSGAGTHSLPPFPNFSPTGTVTGKACLRTCLTCAFGLVLLRLYTHTHTHTH